MELNDAVLIKAEREKVFLALNDPDILQKAIPGCELIEKLSADKYKATIVSKIGPLKIRFKGEATISESKFPSNYKITGEGRGGPAGHAKVVANVVLREEESSTRLAYTVHADIGGKLAQLGGPLVEKTAQKLSANFFEHLNKLLSANTSIKTEDETISSPDKAPSYWAKAAGISAIVAIGILAWAMLK